MERGSGFHGYHHKLPRMLSSSDMTQQGHLVSDHVHIINGKTMPRTNAEDPNECTVREQDRFMPIANVIRIMRRMLPPHAKISDDAKETIQECVSEFISFVTSEANDRCQHEQRKTITAEDVLWAMSKLGFDDYLDPLTLYLYRYREIEGDRALVRSSSGVGIQGFPSGFHVGVPRLQGAEYYGPVGPVVPPCNGCASGGPGQPGFEPYGQQNKG